MSWKTPQEHIAAHCRGGRYDREKTAAQNVGEYNLRCLIGMVETGEIQPHDLQAIGGAELREAVCSRAVVPAASNI